MTFRFRVVFCSLFLCIASSISGSERSDLYERGKEAYAQGKYVTALKNLYAFYVLNEKALADFPQLKQLLEDAIGKCETTLGVLLEQNADVDKGEIYIFGSGRRLHGSAVRIEDLVFAPTPDEAPSQPRVIEDSVKPIVTPLSPKGRQ